MSNTPSSASAEAGPAEGADATEATANSPARQYIDAVLEQSFRHLFGPTATPEQPRKHGVVSIAKLTAALAEYLPPEEIKEVKAAFHFSDEAHLGQYRQSGEPYITHPVAVAEICAGWKLDAQAVMAALLHDVMEDQGVMKSELAERFGPKVAELVDGLSKLDKMEFRSREEAQAENFRKMLLAMARDVRVILVKLADRLHNMRTLGAVPMEKRRRVARETLDIYAPIAHRLGLNNTYRELQDMSFANFNPHRYATLEKAVKAARGNRREVIGKILESAQRAVGEAKLEAEIMGREKTIYSIYRKMRDKQLSFSQVLDVYGFRVVVEHALECYTCIGALHALYKPVPGKFKDYIAIPKMNGYQSLHTTVVGPFGAPIEFQVRTRKMHEIAEAGVAAHWLYKNGGADLNDVQMRAHQWLKSLLDIQSEAGDSSEFLEHVKIDLFPDAVYVFTPKSKIMALPRGATALDFAYSVHSDLGNQCVAVKINNELLPLRTELKSGDIVEVITAPYSKPNPVWLGFVRTGKARSAIRHYLKTMRLNESVQLGERLVDQSLKGYGLSLAEIEPDVWDKLVQWTGNKSRQEIFADIGLGRRVPQVMAKRIEVLMSGRDADDELARGDRPVHHAPPVAITGTEGMSVQLSACCRPIPGDSIMGYIGIGLGMAIHTTDCRVAQRIHRRDPGRWIDVAWAPQPGRLFDVTVKVLVKNTKGIFARVAADITSADANIVHIAMDEDLSHESTVLRFVIQVSDRVHLANVMRRVRTNPDVMRIMRERSSDDTAHTRHDGGMRIDRERQDY
ncbi:MULTISPECIES: RelA/SpoT family protein [Burkholderia]|jgi:guanosine-3',5'-bis(diphosphate) 3'-pyrophosphohydrolase|uniref:Bifunctional (P)ppGpp synthetase/guanosine-3',5'-bis(Diphosphate) 3'-pyrophosphohydrolase n=1 Tax=Burkholderia gladioli TaxID=28095 RepID=A0A095EW08_BURGA|nr:MULTISPECIES: bifunctional (p)ppGpp synthetase/guanosine-3',5'-bis(diphosphate) 3'-pyrophosphohydrolase [Burkholderia]AJW99264.1 RelA/SpoT family protein [Burkholderia gladioli]ASD78357.1 bifunctional (p)ppGpp synthetase/guanosine-3',5'-bis(diphosphate) 3'-pyrophosphohydrolase [Burkholderia gladioli pv. gladioli]ATF85190.1 bifunctional (p)ppGpp synthetase/guanosine-3',5'-bis(diphosphate) 3'-pyrophosphohydrolase [Burkholderia gladioli pv. gladioli]AWY56398.1 bifunctional (p)ppGpp synthetase/g